jgi:hypothetical protein
MLEEQAIFYVDASAQTTPGLDRADIALYDASISDGNTSGRLDAFSPKFNLRNRRHTISNSSNVARIDSITPDITEAQAADEVSRSIASPPPSPLLSCGSLLHTPKRLSDPLPSCLNDFALVIRSPLSSACSSATSDSESVEIIDHRSSFNSPDNFRDALVEADPLPDPKVFEASDKLRADEEGKSYIQFAWKKKNNVLNVIQVGLGGKVLRLNQFLLCMVRYPCHMQGAHREQ